MPPGRQTRIADYELVRLLSEGNHGAFYLAKPPERLGLTAEYVAVKVFEGTCAEDVFRRCVRELRAFASTGSPYLATVYDAVLDKAFLYSMEYFPVGALSSPADALSRDETLRAVEHAALAANALHEAGLAHRDIKPANILLHQDGARLSDLGLSQVMAPGVTVTTMGPSGSVEYMDPALFMGEQVSRASDIWALGATLHRALSGRGLYGELPPGQPLLAVRAVLGASPQIDASLGRRERALVMDCLAPVADRIPTAQGVASRVSDLRRDAGS